MKQGASNALLAIFDEFRSRREQLTPLLLASRISDQNLRPYCERRS